MQVLVYKFSCYLPMFGLDKHRKEINVVFSTLSARLVVDRGGTSLEQINKSWYNKIKNLLGPLPSVAEL